MAHGKSEVKDTDRGWTSVFASAMALMGGRHVKVGVLGATAGEEHPGSELTVGEVAAVNEFGTEDGHVPERSFLRSTFDLERSTLKSMGARLMGQVVFARMTGDQALGLMGTYLANHVRFRIRDGAGIPPPNAPSTLLRKARKGRTARFFRRPARTLGDALAQAGTLAAVRTLVDTGRLANAITWQVEDAPATSREDHAGGAED